MNNRIGDFMKNKLLKKTFEPLMKNIAKLFNISDSLNSDIKPCIFTGKRTFEHSFSTNNRKAYLGVLILLFISTVSIARVTAIVDRSQIVIGETFNLTITADENTSDEPDLSELEQVFTILGNSKSTSTQIINNNYSSQTSWNISLMPQGAGKNTIPPIKVGNEYTNPIQISVNKSDPNAKAGGDIYIEVSTDKTEAYVKEQVIYTVKFFYAMALSEGTLSPPVVKDAVVTELNKSTSYQTTRSGKLYEVVERKYAIFAEKSGTLEINPIIFNGRDNSSRRNFSVFSTGKPVRAVSKPVSIEIKPIPQTSIGKDWIPAKNVQLTQEWSKEAYKVGEPITRTITLYAEGLNETHLPEIDLGEIDGVRVYPEQPNTRTDKSSEALRSWKQVKIALIPTHAGKIQIPEYNLEWFDTDDKKIKQAKLPAVTIEVAAGDFAMAKNEIPNLLNQQQTQSQNQPQSDITNEESPEKNSVPVQIIHEDNLLWKILTFVFAGLWVTTFIYFKFAKNQNNITKDTGLNEQISKKDIISAIRSENLHILQSSLTKWWNQQYPENYVNNLGGIRKLVSKDMSGLLMDLEQRLYSSSALQEGIDKESWLKQINGKGLTLINNSEDKSSAGGLPELYS